METIEILAWSLPLATVAQTLSAWKKTRSFCIT